MPRDATGLDDLLRELIESGVDPVRWVFGAARLLPSVLLVPAFGLRALPAPGRALFALALAACIAPVQATTVVPERWGLALATELATGLPLAVSAAAGMWLATMAGSLIDELVWRHPAPAPFATVDSPAPPFGVLLSLLGALAFLQLGGPAQLTGALSLARPITQQSVLDVARLLVQGINLAVLIAGPLLVLALLFEVFRGLLSRGAVPVVPSGGLANVRGLFLVAMLALLLERIVEAVARWVQGTLPV